MSTDAAINLLRSYQCEALTEKAFFHDIKDFSKTTSAKVITEREAM